MNVLQLELIPLPYKYVSPLLGVSHGTEVGLSLPLWLQEVILLNHPRGGDPAFRSPDVLARQWLALKGTTG